MKIGIPAILIIGFIMAFLTGVPAQSYFRIDFRDKAGSPFSVSKPSEYLSQRSIERRIRQNILFNETDFPVNQNYIDSIVKTGSLLVHSSRWMNSITVRLRNDTLAPFISKISFVRDIQLTKPAFPGTKKAVNKFGFAGRSGSIDTSRYGASVFQVGQMNGQALHNRGFTGKGMVIAVLDAGFSGVDVLPAFDSLRIHGRIAGIRDFVNPSSDVYKGHAHGMMVLSAMGGNLPGRLIGTAPGASYWLIRTEDADSEYPIEEDNWIAGAELADSVGADIINSSLGYSEFDMSEMNHSFADMDGKTTRVARGANLAASKGMLVFASAGNEGNKNWRHIISPADADSVIAVAAVDKNGRRAVFSSVGPSSDGDIKPDLAAAGENTIIQYFNGMITAQSGTSFASPLIAGLAAGLWQVCPSAPAYRIKQALIRSGSLFHHPDSLLGYGIPDMEIAGPLLELFSETGEPMTGKWIVYPNPFRSSVTILPHGNFAAETEVEIFSLTGTRIYHRKMNGNGPFRVTGLGDLPFGMWLMRLSCPGGREVHKIAGGKPQ